MVRAKFDPICLQPLREASPGDCALRLVVSLEGMVWHGNALGELSKNFNIFSLGPKQSKARQQFVDPNPKVALVIAFCASGCVS
jgi:hypothetical protein